eukprot:CAMPEP_0201511534 /NCGR_PEP_ID=MMETSP0161_2-20130828/3982_1 /ASSEMBLY_ACC=CAM_ASM_000251 /TAXON_ID=180227 /ORGANISM="Neoparamoeba aestuarina, Strain SoJaBio B1-5/56/2" /LENGTH=75 /DNA_ID=CAMNT_0047907071 /DNA_START=282 /DNA_END=506 /DNA_ORIENTATION=-
MALLQRVPEFWVLAGGLLLLAAIGAAAGAAIATAAAAHGAVPRKVIRYSAKLNEEMFEGRPVKYKLTFLKKEFTW